MTTEKKSGPYTIGIENKTNNVAPPLYAMSGTSHNPSKVPEEEDQCKFLPAAQQSTLNNKSIVVSLPEIMDNSDTFHVANMGFTEKTIRLAFIKKVFGIVSLLLLITFLVIFGLLKWPQYILFLKSHTIIVLGIALGVYLTTFLAMICFQDARRKVPYNYIFLLLFTLSLSVILTGAILRFTSEQIMYAVGSTFAIVLALTLFALQTKIDFTLLSGSCVCVILLLALLGIGAFAMSYNIMFLGLTGIGVIVISIYIVWDIQLIVGGEHRYSFSPEEYVFAALVLYIDIMYLFIRILRYTYFR